MLFATTQSPFFTENDNDITMSSQNSIYYPQDDILGDPQDAWVTENLDPQLRTVSSQQQQQPWNFTHHPAQPLQRFINAPSERVLFTAPPSYPQYPQGVRTLPQASSHQNTRHISPTPSQDFTSSTSTSGRSPGADLDMSYYSPHIVGRDDFHLQAPGQMFHPDIWTAGQQQQPLYSTNNYHVNMSQVQSFPDTMYDTSTADEGYMEDIMSKGGDQYHYPSDIHHNQHHTNGGDGDSYPYPTDEALGASIKASTSPSPSPPPALESDSEDEDYKPKSSNNNGSGPRNSSSRTTRKRTAPFSYTPHYTQQQPASKRSRLNPKTSTNNNNHNNSKSKSKLPPSTTSSSNTNNSTTNTCPTCALPFKDPTTLTRHIASVHTRPYTCVFHFSGCTSTFASKNEWKRHVSSQHLNLSAWICTLGGCAKATCGNGQRGSEFNRKDLFTQHCRRMHAPWHVVGGGGGGGGGKKHGNGNGNGGGKKNAEWEERLKNLQQSCLVFKRTPPAKLACPVEECDDVFEGAMCWDERMEHVGKHLERAAAAVTTNLIAVSKSGKGGSGTHRNTNTNTNIAEEEEIINQGDDDLLVEWALREGIIVRKNNALGFAFAKGGAGGSHSSTSHSHSNGNGNLNANLNGGGRERRTIVVDTGNHTADTADTGDDEDEDAEGDVEDDEY